MSPHVRGCTALNPEQVESCMIACMRALPATIGSLVCLLLGALLRGKMMAALRELHQQGCLDGFEGFVDPEGFDRLMTQLARHPWVVYAKKPFREVHHVISYLGRYTHRVALANSRLVSISESAVTFRTKSGQTVTLEPLAFLSGPLSPFNHTWHVNTGGLDKIRSTTSMRSSRTPVRFASDDWIFPLKT